MSDLTKLSEAHILLLASQLVSAAELDDLLALQRQRPNILPITLLYRLFLTFYPTSDSAQPKLAVFLRKLEEGDLASDAQGHHITVDPSILSASDEEAIRRCRSLKVVPLPYPPLLATNNDLANFIVSWAHHLGAVSSAQPLLDFVEPFLDLDHYLQSWYQSCLNPCVRLEYELYPGLADTLDLSAFENLSGTEGVGKILQYAQRGHSASLLKRDLEEVVTPWAKGAGKWKRRRLDHASNSNGGDHDLWDAVNEWFVSASIDDFAVTAGTFVDWDGPTGDATEYNRIKARLSQTGLAMIYANSKSSHELTAAARKILEKVTVTNSLPEVGSALPETFKTSLKEADLLRSGLLNPENPLTKPTKSAILFLRGLLDTTDLLLNFDRSIGITEIARLCAFGSEREQKEEFRQLMQRIGRKQPTDWKNTRSMLLWSCDWHESNGCDLSPTSIGLFSHITVRAVDTRILVAALEHKRYDVVKDIYIDTSTPYLSSDDVEATITSAILKAYDNASDGNRDRGDLRPAYDMLRTFRPHFPQSTRFTDIDHLIKATHRLSFYRLNLSHGVPFRPVAIRVQKNPLNLIAKVLDQDHKAYTKLDDLLEIGRSLVYAHLPSRSALEDLSEPLEVRLVEAEHEITRMAIEAALEADDFNTAYSYITTRFASSSVPEYSDDTSWRAAFAAGKHRPSSSPKSLEARIENLAKRMELLSRALTLAPVGDSLAEILGTWRRHEEEMNALREEGVQEERAADARADEEIPGAFGLDDRELDQAESRTSMARRTWPGSTPGVSYEEQAPMGLFDVAKGAASALRKSTLFPIGPGRLQDLQIRDSSFSQPQNQNIKADDTSPLTAGERVRKRDTVANAFVSGMGWVLGAQPHDRNDIQAREDH